MTDRKQPLMVSRFSVYFAKDKEVTYPKIVSMSTSNLDMWHVTNLRFVVVDCVNLHTYHHQSSTRPSRVDFTGRLQRLLLGWNIIKSQRLNSVLIKSRVPLCRTQEHQLWVNLPLCGDRFSYSVISIKQMFTQVWWIKLLLLTVKIQLCWLCTINDTDKQFPQFHVKCSLMFAVGRDNKLILNGNSNEFVWTVLNNGNAENQFFL